MPDYSHLAAPIADSRYVLAAHYLRDCRRIVEIGGQRLHTFMGRDIYRDFWNLDPCGERREQNGIRNLNVPALAFDFNYIGNKSVPAGLCILGMEMYDGGYGLGFGIESANKICTNLHKFSKVIIEFVPNNQVAQLQARMLLESSMDFGLERTITLSMEWVQDREYKEPNDSFSKQRELWVLER